MTSTLAALAAGGMIIREQYRLFLFHGETWETSGLKFSEFRWLDRKRFIEYAAETNRHESVFVITEKGLRYFNQNIDKYQLETCKNAGAKMNKRKEKVLI